MTTKTKSLLSNIAPIQGVPDGKGSNDPTIREAWLNQRRGGITATEIRDWGSPNSRRKIIIGKATGASEDLSHIPAVNHGNLREPIIAEWIKSKFGIEPCESVYSHGDNPRHLASPDGITIDPFSGTLVVGTNEAVIAEIKTSKHDMIPGDLDDEGCLKAVKVGSPFDRANYYTQMQWQMYVMNATRCLFVWEQRGEEIDPVTGTFFLAGNIQWAWIKRDDALIKRLVEDVAPRALEEIDAAVAGATGGMPPASDADPAVATLVAELLKARTAESVAKAAKDKAWKALQEIYLAVPEGADAPENADVDLGFGQITVNTTTKQVMKFNEEGARKRAPKLMDQYEALVKRYTKPVEETKTSFTVTAKKTAG